MPTLIHSQFHCPYSRHFLLSIFLFMYLPDSDTGSLASSVLEVLLGMSLILAVSQDYPL